MPVRSLVDHAVTRLIRNVDHIDDIGGMPYFLIRPVLIKITDPAQLRRLEINSPQLLGETGEIWLKLIKRDFLDWDKKPHEPKDPKLWWKVYRKMEKEVERERLAAEEMLKQRMAVYQKDKEANTTTVTGEYIREPKKLSKAPRIPVIGPDPSMLRFTGGSKTKDPILRFKRQVAEQRFQRTGALTMPTHLLASRATQVKIAPPALVEAKKVELSKPPVFAPRTQTSTSSNTGNSRSAKLMAEHEDRLRAIQAGRAPNRSPPSPTVAAASRPVTTMPTERPHTSSGVTYTVPHKPIGARPDAVSPRPELKRKREVNVLWPTKRTKY